MKGRIHVEWPTPPTLDEQKAPLRVLGFHAQGKQPAARDA